MKTVSQFLQEKETFSQSDLTKQMNRNLNKPEFSLGPGQSNKGSHVTHSITDPKGAEVHVTDPKTKGQLVVGGTTKGKGYTPSALKQATHFNTFMQKVQDALNSVRNNRPNIPGAENLDAFKETMRRARETKKDRPSASNVGQAGRRALAGIRRSSGSLTPSSSNSDKPSWKQPDAGHGQSFGIGGTKLI